MRSWTLARVAPATRDRVLRQLSPAGRAAGFGERSALAASDAAAAVTGLRTTTGGSKHCGNCPPAPPERRQGARPREHQPSAVDSAPALPSAACLHKRAESAVQRTHLEPGRCAYGGRPPRSPGSWRARGSPLSTYPRRAPCRCLPQTPLRPVSSAPRCGRARGR